jgi:hypothetical protein
MASVIGELHVKILGIQELDNLLSVMGANLNRLPPDVVAAYSLFVRQTPKLELVVDNREDPNG